MPGGSYDDDLRDASFCGGLLAQVIFMPAARRRATLQTHHAALKPWNGIGIARIKQVIFWLALVSGLVWQPSQPHRLQ
jgi:hypothetical protein